MAVAKDVFGSIFDRTAIPIPLSKKEGELENTLIKTVQEKGLIAHKPWIAKAVQLHQLSRVNHGKERY